MKAQTTVVVVVVVLLAAMMGCVGRAPEKTNLVLALVGEKRITESDFRRELEQLDPSLRSKYRRDRLVFLEKIIEDDAVYQQAIRRGVDQTPEARKLLARAETDVAIGRLKEIEFYTRVRVAQQEIEERYREEVMRSGGSGLARSVLYVSEPPDGKVQDFVTAIESGLRDGLSFPEIASRHSVSYDMVEFDSPRFSDLPAEIRNMAMNMGNRTGVGAVAPMGMPLYFFKDAEPLSACFRKVRQTIRDEKAGQALLEWLSSQRAVATIRFHEEALEDMSKTEAIVAEVNGVSVTVGDVAGLLEGLSNDDRARKLSNSKALLDEVVDRELLGQEAWRRGLQNDRVVKERAARESRRILVELLTEQSISAYTPAAREKERAEWVERLKKAVSVKVFPENVKKMDIPPSKEIEDVFGGQPL